VLVIPISFVSEHIETLYELDILYKKVAQEAGIPNFRRVPALNSDPTFIRALAEIVESEI
jgi:ferrochelatase